MLMKKIMISMVSFISFLCFLFVAHEFWDESFHVQCNQLSSAPFIPNSTNVQPVQPVDSVDWRLSEEFNSTITMTTMHSFLRNYADEVHVVGLSSIAQPRRRWVVAVLHPMAGMCNRIMRNCDRTYSSV